MGRQQELDSVARAKDTSQSGGGKEHSGAYRRLVPLELFSKRKKAFSDAREWLTRQLAQPANSSHTRIRVAAICAAIFLSAVAVRLLHWQDSHVAIVAGESALSGVFNRYDKEARRMLDEGGILFPRERPADGDARMMAHPPGYAILLAVAYSLPGDPLKRIWGLQIVCDALAAVLIFLLASELLSAVPAVIGAVLVAVSPHLAHYSIVLLPDSLAVFPILMAVLLIVRARKRQSLIGIIAAGTLVGVSCWLRANALLLAPFLGVAILFLFENRRRWVLAAALVVSTIVVVSPITIRNLIVFQRFIPISSQLGLILVEGIGDFDKEGRYGMPRSDREAREKDAEWAGRSDPYPSLWNPNGVERDRIRLERGLAVVRSNPWWFLGVMGRRAAFMLSYNESISRQQPFSTANVSPISSEAGYGHELAITEGKSSSSSPRSTLTLNGQIIPSAFAIRGDQYKAAIPTTELLDKGAVLSQQVVASMEGDGSALRVVGDNSAYGDQFESAPITVTKNTDYVLVVRVSLLNGGMALKITDKDRRTALAIVDLAHATDQSGSNGDHSGGDRIDIPPMTALQMPFASGNRTEVRVVLSNNGTGQLRRAALLGSAEVFETGPTPYVWTGYARKIIRNIQRKFTTDRMLTLILVGISLLLVVGRGRALLILLSVPLYYLICQSPLHTEYRYILAIHYFLFVIAATPLYCAGAVILACVRRVYIATVG